MALRGDVPLANIGVIDEDESLDGMDQATLEEQISLSSYSADDLFVSSAYSKIPEHAQPVFSRRVLAFLFSVIVLKPAVLSVLYLYAARSGRYVTIACVSAAIIGYYVILAARACLLYFNIQRDRLPLSPPLFWILSACLGSLATMSMAAAAYEMFSVDGVFAFVSRGHMQLAMDKDYRHTLAIASAALVALWISALDSFLVATDFFLARFWARAVLNSPIAF
ncbi:integral membrane protein UL20 [Leporid alphaherpesvirus 4]|uniref:Integral membrane protein UL20 n=1 Tax=Leporid alphaherpesvirus 4 TaxID=481315 RepID=J9R058_9ALPH|nr:integral membrane protein UL20 [Leporid alphaherpesvirus 4]AFR32462.1 integral membrane protein UL20 [Leporid alphaherpesvirus 4]